MKQSINAFVALETTKQDEREETARAHGVKKRAAAWIKR
jgi:hypothetical protein